MAGERNNEFRSMSRRIHRTLRDIRRGWRGEVEGEREREVHQLVMNFVRTGAALVLMVVVLVAAVKFLQGNWHAKNAKARGGGSGVARAADVGRGGGESAVGSEWRMRWNGEAEWLTGRKGAKVPMWMPVAFGAKGNARVAYRGYLLALAGSGKSAERRALTRNRWAAWLLEQGRWEEAEEQADWAEAEAPGLPETAWTRMELSLLRGDAGGALGWAGRYRAARPEDERGMRMQLGLLQREGRSREGRALLERFLAGKRGDETGLYLQAAVLAMQAGEPAAAARDLRIAAQGNPPMQVLQVLRSPLFEPVADTAEGKALDRELMRLAMSGRTMPAAGSAPGAGGKRGARKVEPLRPEMR